MQDHFETHMTLHEFIDLGFLEMALKCDDHLVVVKRVRAVVQVHLQLLPFIRALLASFNCFTASHDLLILFK
jgi:hypothetical protein